MSVGDGHERTASPMTRFKRSVERAWSHALGAMRRKQVRVPWRRRGGGDGDRQRRWLQITPGACDCQQPTNINEGQSESLR